LKEEARRLRLEVEQVIKKPEFGGKKKFFFVLGY